MKMLIRIAFLLLMIGTVSSAVAQLAWTAEQKAVWKTETTIMELWKAGDLKEEMTYYDSSYHYWDANSPAPVNKEGIEKKFKYLNTLQEKLEYYNAVPIVIWVEGNFAYANYYFEQTVLAKDGKKTTTNNRWLDVLIKRNGKWLLLAEYGSAYTPL